MLIPCKIAKTWHKVHNSFQILVFPSLLQDGSTMLIEASKGGHFNIVNLLLDWPNASAVNLTAESVNAPKEVLFNVLW